MEQITRTLRRWAQKSHTWVGIVGGVLFCVMGLSGSVIAFRPQIEAILGPKLPSATTCTAFDVEKAVAALNASRHGLVVDRVVFPITPHNPFVFQLRKPGAVRVGYDPCSNRAIGTVNIGWLDWLVDLHHNLLAGNTGRRVVGAIGIVLLFSSFSGIFVWFTANRRRWATIKWSASNRRVVYDLHRSAGLLALLVLLVQACTGVGMAYPELLRLAVDGFGKPRAVAKPKKLSEKKARRAVKPASLNDAIRVAQDALPDGKIRELRGLADSKPIEVRFWRPGDIRSSGNNFVYLNAAGTKVVSVIRFTDQSPGSRLLELFTAIHYGEWGGFVSRMVLTLAGGALAILFVSGLLIRWWPKRGNRALPQVEKNELIAV